MRANRAAYFRSYPRDTTLVQDRIIGIDGEGIGRRPHCYIYLAAADESGKTWSVENPDRLTTQQSLDFILSLPARALIVGYAFLYDLAKILQDLPDEALYLLFREELRARKHEGRIVYRPITWQGYRINFMNRRFSLQKDKRRATIWDIFRFFQGKFTTALIDWKVAAVAELEWMAAMKEKRARFDQLTRKEVYAYCKKECLYLSTLARNLITAHEGAGIKLKTYYGAGSTASALLKSWDISSKRGEVPEAMRQPVACAFFGGRFENSVVGPVLGEVVNYDISSAYPYQATLLPCLLCGSWRRVVGRAVEKRIRDSRLALISWSIPRIHCDAWGPLPVRSPTGTISFPLSAVGGWTWKQEYLSALKLNPHIEVREAWLYETDCSCEAPFSQLPRVYLERLKLGKDDSRGIPLKLGPNSVYGKLAQSRGVNPPFQSWIWAGNITSGTRAQLLDLIASAREPWNVLMVATDGVCSREELTLPAPVDTGTGHTGKPLGGWETKPYPHGMFCLRPGIYFPLLPSETELKQVRARGLGKKILYEQHERIERVWDRAQPWLAGNNEYVTTSVAGVERFVGAKTGVTRSCKDNPKSHYPCRFCRIKRSDDYGEWISHDVSVSFDPHPKRELRLPDNRLQPYAHIDYESVPYNRAMISAEAAMLMVAELIAEEQPDAEFSDADDKDT